MKTINKIINKILTVVIFIFILPFGVLFVFFTVIKKLIYNDKNKIVKNLQSYYIKNKEKYGE